MRKSVYNRYVCIKDCDDGYKNYSDNSIYTYKSGEIYGYNYTENFPLQKNSFYIERHEQGNLGTCGGYHGQATISFVDENFILESEYNKDLFEIDILFQTYMNQ